MVRLPRAFHRCAPRRRHGLHRKAPVERPLGAGGAGHAGRWEAAGDAGQGEGVGGGLWQCGLCRASVVPQRIFSLHSGHRFISFSQAF